MATAEPRRIKQGRLPYEAPTATVRTRKAAYEAPTATVRTDRSGRTNIDAGLTQAQKTALAREEARINRIPIGREETVVVDENGNVNPLGAPTLRSGTRRRGNATITYAEFDSRRVPADSILIHNHPGYIGSAQGLASQVGNAFTGQDLETAATTNVKEIRAIAKGYTYSLKRPAGGWPSGTAMKRDLDRLTQRYYTETMDSIRTRRLIGIASGRGDYYGGDEEYARNVNDRANVMAKSRAMREVAKKYGLKYTRKAHGYNK